MRRALSHRPRSRKLNPIVWGLVRLSALVLVGFHVLLLGRRIADLTIADPWVIVRWLATVALLFVGWRYVRKGGSLVAGRGALAFWIAVFLLHAFALQPAPVPLAESTVNVWSVGLLLVLSWVVLNALQTSVEARRYHQTEDFFLLFHTDQLIHYSGRPPPISFSA